MAQGGKVALKKCIAAKGCRWDYTDLFEDNQRVITMTENPISSGRTKHIEVRYHFIGEVEERMVHRNQ